MKLNELSFMKSLLNLTIFPCNFHLYENVLIILTTISCRFCVIDRWNWKSIKVLIIWLLINNLRILFQQMYQSRYFDFPLLRYKDAVWRNDESS